MNNFIESATLLFDQFLYFFQFDKFAFSRDREREREVGGKVVIGMVEA